MGFNITSETHLIHRWSKLVPRRNILMPNFFKIFLKDTEGLHKIQEIRNGYTYELFITKNDDFL